MRGINSRFSIRLTSVQMCDKMEAGCPGFASETHTCLSFALLFWDRSQKSAPGFTSNRIVPNPGAKNKHEGDREPSHNTKDIRELAKT